MKLYILMDTSEHTRAGGMIGVYRDEIKAKLALAEHVLENKPIQFDYIELVESEVADYEE